MPMSRSAASVRTIERIRIGPSNALDGFPAVDSAAILYLPPDLPPTTNSSRAEIVSDWFAAEPFVSEVITTEIGRVAIITIPMFGDELYRNAETAAGYVRCAAEMAAAIGARCVSLMGVVASATDYGRRVDVSDLGLALSTGHATTAAALAMSLTAALRSAFRDVRAETLGVLGLGSIGISAVRTIAGTGPMPAKVVLCDVLNKADVVAKLSTELVERFGYRGDIVHVRSGASLPEELYACSTIIGCTNVPGILDVTRLRPGTIVVDDSVPHCFKVEAAIRRSEEMKDLLFLAAGQLRSPAPMHSAFYVPPQLYEKVPRVNWWRNAKAESRVITSCVLSALLSSKFDELPPVLSMGVDADLCVRNMHCLRQLGFSAPPIRCGGYSPTEGVVTEFARRFGHDRG